MAREKTFIFHCFHGIRVVQRTAMLCPNRYNNDFVVNSACCRPHWWTVRVTWNPSRNSKGASN